MLATSLSVTAANAQGKVDPSSTVYRTGAILPTESQLNAFPKAPELRAPIPAKFDLSENFLPPVGDQKNQGSCVAWTVGYAARSYYVAKDDKLSLSQPQNVPSPTYIYRATNGAHADKQCDVGMQIFNALETLRGGVVSLADMPYDDSRCTPVPDIAMQKKATKFRISAWALVHREALVEHVKPYLAAGQPVMFGTALAPSFQKHRGAGVYTRVDQREAGMGHAMVLIGYDDARQAVRVQNSWGTGWGDQGRAWISYKTFDSDALGAFVIYPTTGR